MTAYRMFFGLLLISLAVTSTAPVLTPVACCPAPTRKPAVRTPESEVITLVNKERTKRGLKPLAPNPKLMAVSESWSQTQANRRRMYHSRNGYGENVAFGQPTSYDVMQAWMHSRGHRQNILSQRYDSIGVGYVVASNGRPYWTQSFQ